MNPTQYKPRRPDEFIGPAKDLAMVLERIAKRSARTNEPVKVVIRGEPGIGKSALVDNLIEQLGANQWTTTKLNGTQLNVDKIDEWASRLCLREIYGKFRVLRIEEVDKVNAFVQARMLTLLDDLPENVAVICTSNKELKDFDPRFQSRFQVFSLKAPGAEEIKWLLKKFGLRKDDANRIAQFACGNVRLALFDAQSALDELAAFKGSNN
jgi:replication-associated recombination protein RarA